MSTTVTFEHFVGKTLIKIESAVAEQTKKCAFFFFFPQNILQAAIYHRQRDI